LVIYFYILLESRKDEDEDDDEDDDDEDDDDSTKMIAITIFLFLHAISHSLYFHVWDLDKDCIATTTTRWINKLSLFLIFVNTFFTIVGYILLIALYQHSIMVIFNSKLPSLRKRIPSFVAHLSLLRPLEIIFRYLTYSWRVLPDIIVLGEVRCGTVCINKEKIVENAPCFIILTCQAHVSYVE